jgi:IS1 family transposase
MNKLDTAKRVQIVTAMIEGCSIRSIVRITGASKNTIAKLLVELGAACSEYQDRKLRHLACERVQVDEIWSFCYAKQKNVTAEIAAKVPGAGDVWTWIAIDADTKLIPSWVVGGRDAVTARIFISDLRHRVYGRFQITSDGFPAYAAAIERSFEGHIDYAQIVKVFGSPIDGEKRYSPAECIGCERKVVTGYPDPKHISTSYIERQNLSLRMGNRRFTRLTNAFSKKIENHTAALAIFYMHYNFVRIHSSLRVTPAMAAGVTDHLWDITQILSLLEEPKSH